MNHLFRSESVIPIMEIDLTKPFRIGGNPLLKPGGGTSLKAPKKVDLPVPGLKETTTETKSKPKDWVLPGPQTKELEKPVVESGSPVSKVLEGKEEGTGEGFSGTGGGWGGGDGEGGGLPLTRFPRLLNRSEILKMLRKLYPEVERQAGQEGEVTVDLHLDFSGKVTSVNIVDSAGQSFDHVAEIVAKKMKFSPAMIQTTPVAVKLRQSVVFRLED